MNQKGIAHIILLVILIAGLIAGLYLIQHPQIFRPKAAVNAPSAQFVDSSGNQISQTTTANVRLKIVKNSAGSTVGTAADVSHPTPTPAAPTTTQDTTIPADEQAAHEALKNNPAYQNATPQQQSQFRQSYIKSQTNLQQVQQAQTRPPDESIRQALQAELNRRGMTEFSLISIGGGIFQVNYHNAGLGGWNLSNWPGGVDAAVRAQVDSWQNMARNY